MPNVGCPVKLGTAVSKCFSVDVKRWQFSYRASVPLPSRGRQYLHRSFGHRPSQPFFDAVDSLPCVPRVTAFPFGGGVFLRYGMVWPRLTADYLFHLGLARCLLLMDPSRCLMLSWLPTLRKRSQEYLRRIIEACLISAREGEAAGARQPGGKAAAGAVPVLVGAKGGADSSWMQSLKCRPRENRRRALYA